MLFVVSVVVEREDLVQADLVVKDTINDETADFVKDTIKDETADLVVKDTIEDETADFVVEDTINDETADLVVKDTIKDETADLAVEDPIKDETADFVVEDPIKHEHDSLEINLSPELEKFVCNVEPLYKDNEHVIKGLGDKVTGKLVRINTRIMG